MTFHIPDVPLIPQAKSNVCWYAAFQMLIAWKQGRAKATLGNRVTPDSDPELQALLVMNKTLDSEDFQRIARKLGLAFVPSMTISTEMLERLIIAHGPIWFAEVYGNLGHAIIITGCDDNSVYYNDPLPEGRGSRTSMSFSEFASRLAAIKGEHGEYAPCLMYFPETANFSQ